MKLGVENLFLGDYSGKSPLIFESFRRGLSVIHFSMKKRAALSVLVISVVIVTTFQATKAYFTSRAKSVGSTFTVGTLDLEVGGASGSSVEPFSISNIGADANSMTGAKTWSVTNKGTLPGRLYLKIDNLANNENGCNSPEAEVDTTCNTPGTGEGELGKSLTLKAYLNDQVVATTNLDTASQKAIETAWNTLSPVILQAGQTAQVELEWSMAAEGYGNEIQSDSVGFDVDFDLVQVAQ